MRRRWPPPLANDLESRLLLTRVSIFVLPAGIVTVRHEIDPQKPVFFDIDEVVRRWDENADLLKMGAPALLHGLLDVIVDGQFDTIQQLDDAIEALEDGLFDDRAVTRTIQRSTYRLRKELVELRRVVLPMREVINTIMRRRAEHADTVELDSWYSDLYDHVIRAAEWTESLRDMITTVFETNLSLQDARLNTIMKKLTGWAAIIAVPTAVTGWYGQNVLPGISKKRRRAGVERGDHRSALEPALRHLQAARLALRGQTRSAVNGAKGKLRTTNHTDTSASAMNGDHRWCCQPRICLPVARP